VNWLVDCGPGGQEAPGTFLMIALLFLPVGGVLHVFGVEICPWVCYGFAVFLLLQVVVAWSDCWGVYCPQCRCKMRVWPWSR
jgi:hypothetical protein